MLDSKSKEVILANLNLRIDLIANKRKFVKPTSISKVAKRGKRVCVDYGEYIGLINFRTLVEHL